MRIQHLFGMALILSSFSGAAHAELMVGGSNATLPGGHPISQFAANAQGAAAPIRQIVGAATQMDGPINISYEPSEGLLYVSDYWGQAIRVFPAFASGNIAPLRVLNPGLLGQPRGNVPIAALDELIVIAGNCCIYTYPLHASGSSVNRIRSISWGGGSSGVTQLNNPDSLIWIPQTDEVAVVDYDFGDFAAKVVFHARLTDGQAPPTRVLKSTHTANAFGIAHDPIQHKLYVGTFTTSDNLAFDAQIRVFADSASGSDAPLYSIEGPATGIAYTSQQYPSGIGLDLQLQRLMVSFGANGDPSTNRVVSFDLAASGNATPVQVLTGTNLSTGTVGRPFAMPVDAIFANGFDN